MSFFLISLGLKQCILYLLMLKPYRGKCSMNYLMTEPRSDFSSWAQNAADD